ncbi:MAG TPA: hypothetical protein VK742_08060 [Candidatus Sulfotelmatobacter sp.]|jgi:hypothetical protein|nr:hypothetical protein [Candidatus Sulfotelmatobacter sp.]
MTVDTFQPEIAEAMRNFDRYVICLHKTQEEFADSMSSLVQKAIKAYENRAAGLRHGIALDRDTTVILSQAEGDRPLCGIYFNLHSPYRKETLPTKLAPLVEKTKSGK